MSNLPKFQEKEKVDKGAIKKMLSKVFRPKTQMTSPNGTRKGSPLRQPPEHLFTSGFRHKSSHNRRRKLINHNNYSMANLNMKHKVDMMLQSNQQFELYKAKDRSR